MKKPIAAQEEQEKPSGEKLAEFRAFQRQSANALREVLWVGPLDWTLFVDLRWTRTKKGMSTW